MKIDLKLLIKLSSFIIFLIIIKIVFNEKLYSKKENNDDIPVVNVSVVKLEKVPNYIVANGVIAALHSVDLVADSAGKIVQILCQPGQAVNAGDILFVLDHETISAEIEEVTAKMNYQKRNFQRYLFLAKKGMIAKDYIDSIKSQLDQNQAKIHYLQAELSKRIVRAPFSGKLSIHNINVGQFVQSGEKLINLKDDREMILDLSLPSQYIKDIYLGQKVSINEFANVCGEIVAFDASLNSKTHSVTARVSIKANLVKFISGAFVTAYLHTAMQDQMTLPVTALNYGVDGVSVFLVQKNKVFSESVIAEVNQDFAVIKKGNLKPGDVVVSVGGDKLFDGENVKIADVSLP